MISFANVWSLARAEMRTIRRLFRFWLFAVVALFFCLFQYGYFWVIHGLASGYSASAGSFSPKFLLSQTALWQTLVLGVGVVFLAFDLRARDRRDRVIEVLDSRPYSNAELVFGRFFGALFMVWGVAIVAMIIIQGFGHAGVAFGWWVGEPAIWGSVWAYLLIEALPALAVYVAFVQVVSLVSNNRLVAALAGVGLAVGSTFLSFQVPVYVLPSLALGGGFVSSISDVAPQIWTGINLLNRGSFALLGAGLLATAVAVHPRLDDTKRRTWGMAGGAGLLAGAALIFTTITWNTSQLAERDAWRAAHEQRRAEAVVDLQAIRGSVDLERGGRLTLDLEVQFAPADASAPMFSLNPGLEVDGVWDASGTALNFSHDNGLLDIDLGSTPPPGQATGVRIRAQGRPDLRFAYLDAAVDFNTIEWQDAQIVILGNLNGFVERNFVALPASLAWLPRPGAAVGIDDPRQRPRDFFELDLDVRTPSGWTVAGPGKAESSGDGQRFAPAGSVPEVMLVAGRFDRRTTEVEGTEVELLVHPSHLRNLDFFADAREEIEAVAAERFTTARELGLPYPYRQLTLVEVPWTLRAYGGGWRMDTERAPPGMLLLSESGLPTSRFEFRFRNPERFEDQDGGLPRAKTYGLQQFFRTDFTGGNVEVGGVRNLFLYQTGARGPEALALEALCHNLVNRLVNGGESYFSAHLFDREFGWTIANVMQGGFTGQFAGGGNTMSSSIVKSITDRPGVWDAVLGSSLTDMDVEEDPKRAVNALYLKTSALATAILDGAGRERAAAMMANLLRDHRGSTFTAADLDRAAQEAGVDLAGLVGDFLHQTDLPGFIVSPAELERLPDDDQGTPQYQTRLFVRNGEAAPGLFRLRYAVRAPGGARWDSSEPVLIPGGTTVEFGLVTSRPPGTMLASPYLSLNRREFPVELPRVDNETITDSEPLRGTRPAGWMPSFLDSGANTIVVDDLDPGFSVATDEAETGGIRLQGGLAGFFAPAVETDQGLPVYSLFGGTPADWSRYEQPSSWGRYRRTTAVVSKGDGSRRATYRAELPEAGRWRVELHVPSLSPVPGGGEIRREVRIGGGDGGPSTADARGARVNVSFGLNLGTYDLELRNAGSSHPIDFDAQGAGIGWAVLGDFDLASGTVELELSDDTTGNVVAADAVRFVRLDNGAGADPTGGGGAP
ncbi:MAG: ABC transporter permease subunit [Acidobacteria bacterium]|nr:ABC transporter permease subunit [Acidobacteriota bacterium]